ncbi:alpha/beta hydrolase [Nocardioides sp. LS1]|uniref:alpha/beta hydrolase n=1 Tax=Nocardioides sp. LS1 TaxID=1027620 RepID=UPI000F627102|nr:alpha/beta hydrolase [Nocardioides sp. LS1]GCD88068.1 esterase [Nocardioides sp. LS1]
MSNAWTALEREYSPSSMVEDLDALEAEYASMSASVRAQTPPTTHRFGDREDEVLDLFVPASGNTGILHVFLHGGYWQALSKDDASFPAKWFNARGNSYAAVNYTLAPNASLDVIVEQCRKAVGWLHANAAELGFSADRIIVSGSSAGAHLAAMVSLTDWASRGIEANPVKGVVLLSGVYELSPLISTYINDAVKLTLESALELSPLLLLAGRRTTTPFIVTWGEHETGTFKRESQAMADALIRSGAEVSEFEISGRNHFNLVHDLSDPSTDLGREVLEKERKWTNGSTD